MTRTSADAETRRRKRGNDGGGRGNCDDGVIAKRLPSSAPSPKCLVTVVALGSVVANFFVVGARGHLFNLPNLDDQIERMERLQQSFHSSSFECGNNNRAGGSPGLGLCSLGGGGGGPGDPQKEHQKVARQAQPDLSQGPQPVLHLPPEIAPPMFPPSHGSESSGPLGSQAGAGPEMGPDMFFTPVPPSHGGSSSGGEGEHPDSQKRHNGISVRQSVPNNNAGADGGDSARSSMLDLVKASLLAAQHAPHKSGVVASPNQPFGPEALRNMIPSGIGPIKVVSAGGMPGIPVPAAAASHLERVLKEQQQQQIQLNQAMMQQLIKRQQQQQHQQAMAAAAAQMQQQQPTKQDRSFMLQNFIKSLIGRGQGSPGAGIQVPVQMQQPGPMNPPAIQPAGPVMFPPRPPLPAEVAAPYQLVGSIRQGGGDPEESLRSAHQRNFPFGVRPDFGNSAGRQGSPYDGFDGDRRRNKEPQESPNMEIAFGSSKESEGHHITQRPYSPYEPQDGGSRHGSSRGNMRMPPESEGNNRDGGRGGGSGEYQSQSGGGGSRENNQGSSSREDGGNPKRGWQSKLKAMRDEEWERGIEQSPVIKGTGFGFKDGVNEHNRHRMGRPYAHIKYTHPPSIPEEEELSTKEWIKLLEREEQVKKEKAINAIDNKDKKGSKHQHQE